MKIVVVVAHSPLHPWGGLLARACKTVLRERGVDVVVRDLQELGFDRPADADLARERVLLNDLDGLLLIHPLWQNGPPPRLSAYVDRVLCNGATLLTGAALACITTSSVSQARLDATGAVSTLIKGFDQRICAETRLRWAGHLHLGGLAGLADATVEATACGRARAFVAAKLLETRPPK